MSASSLSVSAIEALDQSTRTALFEYLLELGDDRLVIGHRLSEWCGHAPILEEDIALANLALDCIGQAANFLKLAAEIEGKGRDEDALAFLRDSREFRNLHLVELPKGDFAFTMARQFLFSAHSVLLFQELQRSSFVPLAALAEKSLKEVSYHLRHCGEWLVRLGDGTEESHLKLKKALADLWRFTGELFSSTAAQLHLQKVGIAVDAHALKAGWDEIVSAVISQAKLPVPDSSCYMASGGRVGIHTEHLGPMLAEMQILPRSYPGATW